MCPRQCSRHRLYHHFEETAHLHQLFRLEFKHSGFPCLCVIRTSNHLSLGIWMYGCIAASNSLRRDGAMGAMIVGLCSVSILSLACISFNRYLLIVHGIITYRKIFNRRYIPLLVASSWLWGNSVLIPPFLGWGGLGYNDGKGLCDFDSSIPSTFPYEVYVICFSLGIPLTVTCICYVRIFLTV